MDLVERERAEIAVLETFLPPPMDEADVVCAIDTAIAEIGASSPTDMGRVMKRVMAQLSGPTGRRRDRQPTGETAIDRRLVFRRAPSHAAATHAIAPSSLSSARFARAPPT